MYPKFYKVVLIPKANPKFSFSTNSGNIEKTVATAIAFTIARVIIPNNDVKPV